MPTGLNQTCKDCAAGYEFTSITTKCTSCENGKYHNRNDEESATCKTCAAGLSADDSTVVCSQCSAGKYQELPESDIYGCKFCESGMEFTTLSTSCTTCDVGKYQHENDEPLVTCSFCVAGRSFLKINKDCDDCPLGKYQNENDLASASCRTCDAGKDAPDVAHKCVECSTGKFQELQISVTYSCSHCSAGKMFSTKATECDTCAMGMYQEQSLAPSVNCKFCETGKEYVDIETNCTTCRFGLYQNENDLSAAKCKTCAAGAEFQDINITCSTCNTGRYQDENNVPGVNCKDCVAGKEFDTLSTKCSLCANGRYQHENAAASVDCSFCAAGRQYISTSVDCEDCADGKYQDENDLSAAPCKFCAAGREFYTTADPKGSLACKLCNVGKYQHENAAPSVDCSFCAAGYQFKAIGVKCDNCIEGKYQHENNLLSADCKTCGKGKAAPDQFRNCEKCKVGKFQELPISLVWTCKFCQPGTEFDTDTTACTSCFPGKYQDETIAISVECGFCPTGWGFQTSKTPCVICEMGRYQNDSEKAGASCKFCEVGRYLGVEGGVYEIADTGEDKIGCLLCRLDTTAQPPIYDHSPCPGAELCIACPPGQISTKARDGCEIGSIGSDMPQVELAVEVVEGLPALCYLINTAVEGRTGSTIQMATGLRITYAMRKTELSAKDGKRSIDIRFVNATYADVEACFNLDEDNVCNDPRKYSTSSKDLPFRKTYEVSASADSINMTVVTNAPESPNGATRVCLRPEIYINPSATKEITKNLQQKSFYSQVAGLFDGTLGDTATEAFQWIDTSRCGNTQYLDNTNLDPRKWRCLTCPKGAGCSGGVVWSDVRAMLGYYRLRREDCACCGTPPNSSHPNGVFYNQRLAEKLKCYGTTVPDQFEPCVYKTGCYGAPNKDLRGRFYVEHNFATTGADNSWLDARKSESIEGNIHPLYSNSSTKYTLKKHMCHRETIGIPPETRDVLRCDLAMNTTLHEQCNELEGFANNCSRFGKLTECRLCRTCLTGYFGDGFSACEQCPPPESTVTLTLVALGLMFLMLYLFIKTALEEAEQISDDDTNFSHLAQSMQKILINHAQLVSIAGTFPLNWPKSIQFVFQIQKIIGEPAESAANPQCYAAWLGKEEIKGASTSRFFPKQMFMLSMPIAVTFLTTLYFCCNYMCCSRRPKKQTIHPEVVADHSKQTKLRRVSAPDVGKSADQPRRVYSKSRTKLREIFNEADTTRSASLTQKQFTTAVMKHGAELGHLWTPSEIRDSFHAAKMEGNSWFSLSGGKINFNGFVAVVVKHMESSRKRQRRLSQARGVDLRVLHLKSLAHKKGLDYDQITHKDKWVATLVSFFYLLYPVLTRATFALVGCHYVGEKSYVQLDMQVPCWDTEDREHLDWVIALFIPSLLLYVIGLPLIGVLLLSRVRNVLDHDKHSKFRYSVLLVGYRSETFYWEAVVAVRKTLIIGTSVFLVQAGPRWQTLVAQALNAILLIVHTQFRPFERVNKKHNTLHNADFFALATSFLTLSSGIFLFQSVGTNVGFRIFLQIVVVGANILFIIMAVFWYLTLRLFDMGNSLSESDENKEFSARFVLCLQRCLPDWREESIKEEIKDAEKLEHQAMGRADLIQLLAAKKVARKWITKTKLGRLEKQAKIIQDEYHEDQEMMAARMDSLKKKAKSRLQARKERRASTLNIIGSSKKTTPKKEKRKLHPAPPTSSPKNKSPSHRRISTPKGTKLTEQEIGQGNDCFGMDGVYSSPSNLGTPKFRTANSRENLAGTPKFTSKAGKNDQTKKKQKKGLDLPTPHASPKLTKKSGKNNGKIELKKFQIIKGMRLTKLGFKLRAPTTKTAGYCWVSDVDFSGPAAAANIRDGDMIYTVAGKSTANLDHRDVIELLKSSRKPFSLGFKSSMRINTKEWRESHYHISALKEEEQKAKKKSEEESKQFT